MMHRHLALGALLCAGTLSAQTLTEVQLRSATPGIDTQATIVTEGETPD